MTDTSTLLRQRYARIRAAVELQKPDQTPVVIQADAFCANNLGVPLSQYIVDPKVASATQLKMLSSLGGIDAVEIPYTSASALSACWLSNMKLPGRELPEGELWQVDERELMTVEDYDFILAKGFGAFFYNFAVTKLSQKRNVLEDLQNVGMFTPQAIQNYEDLGMGVFTPVVIAVPYDVLGGGRSLVKFMGDLRRMPDKVEAVLDIITTELIEMMRGQIRGVRPFGVWINGMRCASEFMSPKLWERMVFPSIKRIVDAVIEEGAVPFLHFDSNWERDLACFRELPKGKCVFGLDGMTNIFKVKEVLGDHMCIKGDVPASMMVLGNPDDVSRYSERLIREVGPSGFILSQACCIPPNAKVENLKALISVATA